MKKGIVLFGHGSRSSTWAAPFHALRDEILRLNPAMPVELAYLELMTPDLPGAVTRLADLGVTDIVVVPVFIAAGSHVRADLPELVAAAMTARPGVAVHVAASLGESPEMLAAMARYALSAGGVSEA